MNRISIAAQNPNTTSTSPSRCHSPACAVSTCASRSNSAGRERVDDRDREQHRGDEMTMFGDGGCGIAAGTVGSAPRRSAASDTGCKAASIRCGTLRGLSLVVRPRVEVPKPGPRRRSRDEETSPGTRSVPECRCCA